MSLRKIALSAAAVSLAAAPAMAQSATDRTSAPAADESELGASPILLGAAIVAVIIGLILILDDDPNSP